ncbi:MAG: cadherin-like beta sandwich domain-containing protein [Ruminococcus sp.]|nr:cadherin-like beta sandwich domain-containing protein [Ruminococcus sp.]
MMNKRHIKYILLSLCLFLFPKYAYAANLNFSGTSVTNVDSNFEIILNINAIDDPTGIAGIGGVINYDSEYLELVSYKSLAVFNIAFSKTSSVLSGFSMSLDSRIMSNSNLIKFIFKAKKMGNTTISMFDSELSNGDAMIIPSNNPSKDINIVNNLDSNANLKSLSLSSGKLNFNENTTNYDVSVSASTNYVTIDGITSSNKATTIGLGTYNLNYGKNSVEVIVTAEDGSTKSYTINITRKEKINTPSSNNTNSSKNVSSNNSSNYILSSNNDLKSLTVNGSISPVFNPNINEYNVVLASDIEKLVINAVPSDKATLNIIGDTTFNNGEEKNVNIEVKAENNNIKVYKLNVKRELKEEIPINNTVSSDSLDNTIVDNKDELNSTDLFHLLIEILLSVIKE